MTATRVAFLVMGVSATSCLSDDVPTGPTEPPPEPEPRDTTPPVYVTRPPEGKLPWPQHDPSWTQARYQQDLADLWVVNNFALYQGSEDPTSLYLHDGLDVVRLRLHARRLVRRAAGRARAPGGPPGGGQLQRPRARPPGSPGAARRRELVRMDGPDPPAADTFFTYTDTEPPIFEGRFRYVADGTDDSFGMPPGEPTTVSGDVDIVVGLRDPGEWARSKVPFGGPDTYGDRNAPNRAPGTSRVTRPSARIRCAWRTDPTTQSGRVVANARPARRGP